nr:hypothetical protein Iba_chr04bCG9630 [Ipomoea batatas]
MAVDVQQSQTYNNLQRSKDDILGTRDTIKQKGKRFRSVPYQVTIYQTYSHKAYRQGAQDTYLYEGLDWNVDSPRLVIAVSAIWRVSKAQNKEECTLPFYGEQEMLFLKPLCKSALSLHSLPSLTWHQLHYSSPPLMLFRTQKFSHEQVKITAKDSIFKLKEPVLELTHLKLKPRL